MQPPKRRSLDEIAAGPVRPIVPAPVAPRPAPPSTEMWDPKALGRQIAQGLSFGFADEIEAGVTAGFTGASYKDIRDTIRAGNHAYEQANPKMAFGAQLAGGLLTGGGALVGAGRATVKAAAPSVMRQIGRAIATGGATGGVAGVGVSEGESANELLRDGVMGGVLGAAAGGTVASVAKAAPWAVQRGKALVRGPNVQPAKFAGANRVLDAVDRSGRTLDDIAKSFGADDTAILAERIGEPGIETLGSSARLGYGATEKVKTVLDSRASEQIPRVRRELINQTEAPVSPKGYADQKLIEAQTGSKPLFEQALEGVQISDPRVVDMLKRPALRQAYKVARDMAANDGMELPPVDAIFRNASRGAGDVADETIGGVATRAARTESGALRDFSKVSTSELVDELENLTTRQQRDMGQSIYNYVDSDNASGSGTIKIATANRKGGGPSMQAKAQRRVELTDGVIDRITEELDARGVSWVDAMARRTAGEADDFVEDAARSVPGRKSLSLPEPEEAPSLPSLTGEQFQYLKHALDDQITKLEGLRGGTSTKRYAQIVKARGQVDDMLDEFTNKTDDGGSLWGQANEAYGRPMRELDGFKFGSRETFNIGAEDVEGLLTRPDARDVSKGVSNQLLRTLGKYNKDAATGNIRNPATLLTGSSDADARLMVAVGGDEGKAGAVRKVAKEAARNLDTRYRTIGNSLTAPRAAADARQLSTVVGSEVGGGPTEVAKAVGRRLFEMANRRATGRELDDAADLLLAGYDGQITLQDAMNTLTAAQRKRIGAALRTQYLQGGAVGGVIGQQR